VTRLLFCATGFPVIATHFGTVSHMLEQAVGVDL